VAEPCAASSGTPAAELLSTRLFPKGQGAHGVQLTGLAGRCDWAVLSDHQPPQAVLSRRQACGVPATIFLSLRNPFAALHFFHAEVLPLLHQPFVLVSGSEDVTLPLQCDQRWRSFTAEEECILWQIAQHPLLRCWWAENLDWAFSAKVRPLPLGVLPGNATAAELLAAPQQPRPVLERELSVLCAHRERPGPQWRSRAALSDQLRQLDRPWIHVVDEELPPARFAALLQRCSFVICASGGGWDPCPKLWHALLQGAIPVVCSGALDPVWQPWPVWVVERWHTVDWSRPALERRRAALAERFPPRHQLLQALSLESWWQRIVASLDGTQAR
jgi:hypothetical protein